MNHTSRHGIEVKLNDNFDFSDTLNRPSLYTAAVDEKIKFLTFVSLHADIKFFVPKTLFL